MVELSAFRERLRRWQQFETILAAATGWVGSEEFRYSTSGNHTGAIKYDKNERNEFCMLIYVGNLIIVIE